MKSKAEQDHDDLMAQLPPEDRMTMTELADFKRDLAEEDRLLPPAPNESKAAIYPEAGAYRIVLLNTQESAVFPAKDLAGLIQDTGDPYRSGDLVMWYRIDHDDYAIKSQKSGHRAYIESSRLQEFLRANSHPEPCALNPEP